VVDAVLTQLGRDRIHRELMFGIRFISKLDAGFESNYTSTSLGLISTSNFTLKIAIIETKDNIFVVVFQMFKETRVVTST